MEQTSKLQKAAVDLILKYFGQSTAEVYAKFFNGENDSEITNSLTEIMTDYIGETKAKADVVRYAPMKVNNTICPVTGKPVDMNNPVTVQYRGKMYNVCCSMCPETFKSDPKKYSKIAEEQAKTVKK